MFKIDPWNGALAAIGIFIALTTLVRLMLRRRDQLVSELTAQAREEQQRKQLAEFLAKKKQKRKAA